MKTTMRPLMVYAFVLLGLLAYHVYCIDLLIFIVRGQTLVQGCSVAT